MTVFKLGNLWGKLVQEIESFYPKPYTHIDPKIGYFLLHLVLKAAAGLKPLIVE